MDTCILCKSSKKDEIQYGEFLKNDHFGVHTFCLYLSSNLSQGGKDDEGLLGFLEADILKEVRRISFLKCCYCNKRYANIGCCTKKCRNTFHLICGIENKAANQFCRDFRSFCHRHVTKVQQRPSSKETCLICYEKLQAVGKRFDSVNIILTPCCRNGWFHKMCLQKFAKTAGYFFKCPLCNDADTFREMLPLKGIFIPNQDAAWEMEPNAFAELLERPNECGAEVCKNKKGRKASSDNNPFVICATCGSTAIHRQCLLIVGKQFHCIDCSVGLTEDDSGRESLNSHLNADDNEGEYIDVCQVSYKEDLEVVSRLIANNNKVNESKRDSGTHHHDTNSSDEEMPHSATNLNTNRRIRESSEKDISSYDTDCEDVIKPTAVTRKTRLKSYSEASNSSYETRSRKKYIKSKAESSIVTSENKEIIHRGNVTTRRLQSASESSDAKKLKVFKAERLNSPNIFRDSDDEDQLEMFENTTPLVYKKTEWQSSNKEQESSISSTQEQFVNSSRKRKTMNVLNDLSKQKRLHSETNENDDIFGDSYNSSIITVECESSDDDDPLENFSKLIKEQNNTNCYSFMTENKRDKTNLCGTCSNQAEKDLLKKRCKIIKFENLQSTENSNKENNLDISCIAKRTRRKTFCSNSNNVKNEGKEIFLNNSYIALRTRRKTICDHTYYSREMSQVYEKNYTSEEDSKLLSDSESSCLDNFIADNAYEEKKSHFEISCIANRTRKRESMRTQTKQLPNIYEIIDCSSETSNTSDVSNINRSGRI